MVLSPLPATSLAVHLKEDKAGTTKDFVPAPVNSKISKGKEESLPIGPENTDLISLKTSSSLQSDSRCTLPIRLWAAKIDFFFLGIAIPPVCVLQHYE